MKAHAGKASPVITGMDVREYFHYEVHQAIDKQHVAASAEATCYVVNLLTTFLHTDRLYEHTPDGRRIKALALMYGEALEAPTAEARHNLLRRLADVALFISGVFSDSLNRNVVDVDYYVAMGGSAYAYLSDNVPRWMSGRALHGIFSELSDKFQQFVDVLNEVSERAHLNSDSDVLRLYEVWLKTGSPRARQRLMDRGLQPVWLPAKGHHHN
ncbi:MAG: hypothetical protein ACT4NU_02265 [Chromatiales bacterium]